MNGTAHGRHRRGRAHVGEKIVIAATTGHSEEAVRRFNVNLEYEAGVVFEFTSESCLEFEALGFRPNSSISFKRFSKYFRASLKLRPKSIRFR